VSRYDRRTGQTHAGRPRHLGDRSRAADSPQPQRAHHAAAVVARRQRHLPVLRVERGLEDGDAAQLDAHQSDLTRANVGRCRRVPASTQRGGDRDRSGRHHGASPSPLDVEVIWAGTDDGNVQVTMDGGTTWTNVTPPAIKPWTRIFNIEAGHFDKGTAYAAANTMRLDDMNPHFFRTRDGGKTWTEINTGIAPGAVERRPRRSAAARVALRGDRDCRCGCRSTTATTGSRCKLDMPAGVRARHPGQGRQPRACAPISWRARTVAASGFSTT
jgi:hypothetical protein